MHRSTSLRYRSASVVSNICILSFFSRGPYMKNSWITLNIRAHGVVVSHPLRMRKALGSNPSVSILALVGWGRGGWVGVGSVCVCVRGKGATGGVGWRVGGVSLVGRAVGKEICGDLSKRVCCRSWVVVVVVVVVVGPNCWSQLPNWAQQGGRKVGRWCRLRPILQ